MSNTDTTATAPADENGPEVEVVVHDGSNDPLLGAVVDLAQRIGLTGVLEWSVLADGIEMRGVASAGEAAGIVIGFLNREAIPEDVAAAVGTVSKWLDGQFARVVGSSAWKDAVARSEAEQNAEPADDEAPDEAPETEGE